MDIHILYAFDIIFPTIYNGFRRRKQDMAEAEE